jgi:hypothetical protein
MVYEGEEKLIWELSGVLKNYYLNFTKLGINRGKEG